MTTNTETRALTDCELDAVTGGSWLHPSPTFWQIMEAYANQKEYVVQSTGRFGKPVYTY